MRLFLYFTLFNITMSIFISHLFSGSVDLVAISDNLGNLVFFEAMIFFCVGSFVDMSHSPKWSTIMKLLKLRNVEWNVQESSEAGRRASVYIVTGMLFFLQSIILAII